MIEMCEELRRAARLAGVITREYKREGIAESRTESETLIEKPRISAEVSVSPGVSVSCEVCGRRFEGVRKTARYCSAACRLRAHRG